MTLFVCVLLVECDNFMKEINDDDYDDDTDQSQFVSTAMVLQPAISASDNHRQSIKFCADSHDVTANDINGKCQQ